MASSTTDRDARASGILEVCATPIGNMGDSTVRVIEALGDADVIFAEDTRVTRKLLSRHGISTPIERCDENVTASKIPEIIERVASGQRVAFVSDAGMPCISDPGQRVVEAVRQAGLAVTVLPGASAVVTAVAGCGIPAKAFYFGGFLPRKSSERASALRALSELDALLVFYESNHRTLASLSDIAEVFPRRRVCMARELTKIHEEYLVADAISLLEQVSSREGELKGEVVLVIGPPAKGEDKPVADDSSKANPEDTATELAASGMGASKIARELSRRFSIPKEEAYGIAMHARSSRE